jgi:transposase
LAIRLYTQYRDETFADCYHKEGKPALSPVVLAFVTIFQSLENLPDRKAARMLAMRLDWKYALHLPIDAGSFDASVLCEFRQRLLAHKAEARVFEQVLTQMKTLGLLQSRGVQRTDSLSLLSRARELGRRELVFETMRVALRALHNADDTWLSAWVPVIWADRYRTHCCSARLSDDERTALDGVLGSDMYLLLHHLDAPTTSDALRDLAAIAVLRSMWYRHFDVREGEVCWRVPAGADADGRIETPYDPEARWCKKREYQWIGYKLQLTESDDVGKPHLITDIAVTSSTASDRTALEEIAPRQIARGVAPRTRYVDNGYTGGPSFLAADKRHEDLCVPMQAAWSPQADIPDGLTNADFQVDVVHRTAICPTGHAGHAKTFHGKEDQGDQGIVFTFRQRHCRACPLKARCISGKGERRYLTVRHTHARSEQARTRYQNPAFKAAYARHRAPVEGCLSALVRGQGIRQCRYAGRAKNNLRALFIGAAVNLQRAAAWKAGKRHRPKRKGLVLRTTRTHEKG